MIYRFETQEAYYASFPSPAESLTFEWDTETGIPNRFEWVHGGVLWFLFSNDSGQITGAGAPESPHYDIDLRILTVASDPNYPNTLQGKLTVASQRPSGVTFAATLEGTGSHWLVADGTLIPVGDP
jgi:hypothetical protein